MNFISILLIIVAFTLIMFRKGYVFVSAFSKEKANLWVINFNIRNKLIIQDNLCKEEHSVFGIKKIVKRGRQGSLSRIECRLGEFERVSYIINREKKEVKNIYIAHAMGEIDGMTYTNSLEAFLKNYEEGYRFFEGDLIVLENREIVLFHEKKDERNYWIDKSNGEVTPDDLKNFKYNNKYKVLDLTRILQEMKVRKDFYFILDMKVNLNKITYANKKFIKILEKLGVDYRNSPFFKRIFEKLRWKKRVETKDKEILTFIVDFFNGNNEYLDRIIPQVHIENIYDVYGIYDFPLMIWKDGQDSMKNDFKNIKKHNMKLASISKSKINKSELKENLSKTLIYSIKTKKELTAVKQVNGAYLDISYKDIGEK